MATTTATSSREAVTGLQALDNSGKTMIETMEIHNVMPYDKSTESYWTAVERCPHVVLSESPPEKFQAYCAYPQAAARRLALYWKIRRAIFGDNDAYLPLNQALNQQPRELELLRLGMTAASGPDSQGRMIAFMDRSRIQIDDYEPSTRYKSLFTFFHFLQATCFASNCHEVVFVLKWSQNLHLCNFGNERADLYFVKLLVGECLCFKTVQFNVIATLPQGVYKTFLSTFLPSIVQRISERFVSVPIIAHVGSQDEVLDSLKEHGVQPANLPTTIGGSWSYDLDFVEWLKHVMPHQPAFEPLLEVVEETKQEAKELVLLDDAEMMSICSELVNIPMEEWENLLGGGGDDEHFDLDAVGDLYKNFDKASPLLQAETKEDSISPPPQQQQQHVQMGSTSGAAGQPMMATGEEETDVGRDTTNASPPPQPTLVVSHDLNGEWLREVLPSVKGKIAAASLEQALKQCPMLVQLESPPAQYLAFADGNALEAATRLASYWDLRAEIFGPESAFTPLSQAMSSDELLFSLQGVNTILPNADKDGRVTIFVDRARAEIDHFPEQVRAREFFFVLHHMNKLCYERRVKEFVGIFRWTPYTHGILEGACAPRYITQLVRDILCAKPKQFNVIATLPNGANRQFWSTMVPLIVRRLHDGHTEDNDCSMVVHAGTPLEVMESLQEHGLVPEHLPTTIGGSWSYARDWPEWLQSHVDLPLPKPKSVQAKADAQLKANGAAIMLSASAPPPREANKQPPPPPLEEEAAVAVATRQLSVSRRRANRNKTKEASLAATVLENKKKYSVAAAAEDETLRRVRQQNVIYSRRKRAKENMRVKDLQATTSSLESENKKLRREELRLQHLLAQARLIAAQENAKSAENVRTASRSDESRKAASIQTGAPLAQCLESLRRRQEVLTMPSSTSSTYAFSWDLLPGNVSVHPTTTLGGRRSSDETTSHRSGNCSGVANSGHSGVASSGHEETSFDDSSQQGSLI